MTTVYSIQEYPNTTTPTNPSSGKVKLYAKSNKLFRLDSTGSEIALEGVASLSAVGLTPNTAGGTVSGSTLTLQPADGTNPGVLSAGSQVIGGIKTFAATPVLQGGFTTSTSNGFVTFGGIPTASAPATSGIGAGRISLILLSISLESVRTMVAMST